MSWEDTQELCRKTKLQLPTEAQWEYACRGGSTTPFTFGCSPPAAHLGYNGFGLYFMHGIQWDWCRDTYDRDFYRSPAASGLDPVNNTDSNTKVLRGGSWKSTAADCRPARRMAGVAFIQYGDSGFRPVWSFYPTKD
jgi:formylglycine-generating enzyme required for sulfatase activity